VHNSPDVLGDGRGMTTERCVFRVSKGYRSEGGEGRGNPDAQRAAEQYLRAGVMVIPIATAAKNPNRSGWQRERHAVEDVPRLWTNGQGIGALWGEPSGGLVDIDQDWLEARIAARHILPETRTFGRPGAPESHSIYRVTDTIPKSKRYKIGGDSEDRSVVEVLSTGTQSLVPPSLHASGERRVWHRDQPAAEIDGEALMEGVADVATAALVARNWPGQGARHDYTLAATGYIGRRLPRGRVERIMEAAIAASGDDEAQSRLRDVQDTLDNVAAGRPTTGGRTLAGLAPSLVDQLRRWHSWGSEPAPHQTSGHGREPASFNTSDLGNSERLVARHGDDLRYCHPWGRWLIWDGQRWAADVTGEIERRAVETIRSIYVEAGNEPDYAKRKALADHAKRSESRSRLEAMIALARSLPGVPVRPEELDTDRWLFNCESGTINLESGELREHRREDLITKLAPVDYKPSAVAPRFLRFLREVFDGDEDLIAFVQRFAGYSLTGSVEERVFAILHGRGKNGKSTLVELLQEMMGDYAATTDTETILAKRYQGVGNDIAALKGARFVSAAEVEQDRRLAESKVKTLTGNDTVSARFLYSEPFSFKPEFKIWLSTNNKPVIRGVDDAVWDRIRLVPFEQRFVGDRRDPKLPEKLREEMAGVLSWAVRGCLEWVRNGLGEPERVRAATEDYRAEQDTLAAFFEDRCVIHPRASAGATPLYSAFKDWCDEAGEQRLTQTKFGRQLRERGFRSEKAQRVTWYGIGLRDNRLDPDDPVDGSDPDPGGEGRSEGSDGGTNRLNAGGWDTNRLKGESRIGAPDINDRDRQLDSRRPFLDKSLADLPHEEEFSEKGLKPSNRLRDPVTQRDEETCRRLTAGEAERVQRLIGQGMRPKYARAEVLGDEEL
jgi:putative DNA primase/helicase